MNHIWVIEILRGDGKWEAKDISFSSRNRARIDCRKWNRNNPGYKFRVHKYVREEGMNLYDHQKRYSRHDVIKLIKAFRELEEKGNSSHDWNCGCGHWNGANLATCTMCGRNPSDSFVQKEEVKE